MWQCGRLTFFNMVFTIKEVYRVTILMRHAIKPNAKLTPGEAGSEDGVPGLLVTQPTHEQLLHFFHESPDLLCIAGFDGTFKSLSPSWPRLLGWTMEELQARPFLDFVHPKDRSATLAEMAKLVAGILTITFENRYSCKDGSWKWLQWTSSPLPDSEEIHAVARDITLRKQLERQNLITLDHERERMGRELHDGLCQDLAAIAALSASLARRLVPIAEPEAAVAREIGTLLNQSIRHARDLAHGDSLLHLAFIGLVAALTDFCLKTGTLFQINCTFRCEPRPPRLGAKREAHLYRIAQEAVNNAINHGKAQNIVICLSYRNGVGTLEILDDGIGVQPTAHPGIGLQTMASRASLIGGKLELKPHAPCGTLVTCGFSLLAPTPHS